MASMAEFSTPTVEAVGGVLNDPERSLAERFRALFTLRNIAGERAISEISKCFGDPSALLKHECAYCLGQIQDPRAIPVLRAVLEDASQEAMVRHEAGEALGAIGDPSTSEMLERYVNDSQVEVAETCLLALERIRWITGRGDGSGGAFKDGNPYKSVDPSPPSVSGDVEAWQRQLNDTSLSLFERYRALFALRNYGGKEAVQALASGFNDTSALFKHELAYVLGQMQDESAVSALREKLGDLTENPMVRHECAEALGSIATPECMAILQRYLDDKERVVRESCVVALDMYAYEQSSDFQYANTASQMDSKDDSRGTAS